MYLLESYYKGVRTSQIPSKSMTKYQWKFTKTIDKADLNKVESIKDSIDTMTNVRFAHEIGRLTGVSSASALDTSSGSGTGAGVKRTLGPSMPPPSAVASIGPRRPMTADDGKKTHFISGKKIYIQILIICTSIFLRHTEPRTTLPCLAAHVIH